MRERLHRMHQEIQAGSPRPEFEIAFDPLGLIAPALKPFAENNSINRRPTVGLTGPDDARFSGGHESGLDRRLRVPALDAEGRSFRAHARAGWNGGPLDVLVTGRAAYVSEISLSMRYDIVVTVLGSIVLVSLIFFAGFRRWIPLLGMGFSLLLSCLVALALGLLIFRRLNMVTVGFCAILVGLGVDFAILMFGRYQQARIDNEPREQGRRHRGAKTRARQFFLAR